MNVIRTESPSPLRLAARAIAACRAIYLRTALRAARADAEAYASQADHCHKRAVIATREAMRLQRQLDAVR
jgi:uncharacterized OsmC-like protein